MFYKSDIGIVKIAMGIQEGLEKDYDYVLVVSGDTGAGKSMWGLHWVELWQKLINKPIDDKLIKQINVDKLKWLNEFKNLKPFDINLFDEGAAGLGSKQYMETFSKTMEMLFQVIRYKRFHTVLIVPNFFRLNKFFREDRLRGLVYINKRGQYKFYTRKQIIKLCAYNDKRTVKNMNVVSPIYQYSFPDYKGILRDAYNEVKDEGVETVLKDVIAINVEKPKFNNLTEAIRPRVTSMYMDERLTISQILTKFKNMNIPVSRGTVGGIVKELRQENLAKSLT